MEWEDDMREETVKLMWTTDGLNVSESIISIIKVSFYEHIFIKDLKSWPPGQLERRIKDCFIRRASLEIEKLIEITHVDEGLYRRFTCKLSLPYVKGKVLKDLKNDLSSREGDLHRAKKALLDSMELCERYKAYFDLPWYKRIFRTPGGHVS